MFGGSGFGTGQTTFGTGGFGTATSTGGSVFGQQAQPQQTSLFGGGGTAFGGQQTGLPAFGAGAGAVPQAGAFGGQAASPSVFGQQVRPNTGIFSSPGGGMSPFQAGQTNLGQQMVGTAHPFAAITGTDTMMKNGAASQINTRHQCITCMKEYENKSLEELRLEDYQVNRKGQQQAGMFGGVTAGQPQVQQGASLFSGIGAGTATAGTSTFGQTTAFGQPTSTAGGGLFGSLNQSKPGVFFGAGANPSTSTAFGGGSSLGFSFSNPTSQPQTSIFGANNNPATSQTGLGTQGAFSFSTQPQQQQQQGLGLFGQKPLTTPASNAPAFGSGGFGGAPANTTLNKPLFGGGATATPTFGGGSTAPTFGTGTGSLFSTNTQQQQQQNKPFTFSTPFSSTAQPASQPTFGTTNTSTFSFSNPVSTPQINFGGAAAPSFGNTGTTGTSSTFGAPLSFSLGSNTQQQQPGATGPSFSSGFFSSNTNNPVSGVTGTGVGSSLFGQPAGGSTFGSGFGSSLLSGQHPTFQLQQQQQQQHMQQQQLAPGAVSFATTPYKDNHLFYNLISNRRVEDMTKPTNPLAQRTFREASRRKTSTSISAPGQVGQVSNVSIGLTPAVKNLTFSANSKNSSLTKFHVFDGFQDEDMGIGIDVLSPKTNVKRLVLKSADNNFCVPLTSSSSTLMGGEGASFGLARRASLLSGMTPPVSKGSFESPLSQQRRVRITSLHNLNPGNMAEANGEPIIRKLDFGDSLMSADGHLTMLGDNLNHSGEGDSSEVIELFSHANGGLSSKRGSEVDIGGVLNGNAHGSGQFAGSVAGTMCGVICTRPGYYVKPVLEELDKKMDSNGNCVVTGFEVGRLNFGRIKYYDPVNVANINLDEIVFFRHKEVVVYPDDENKPELGKGINAPAEIELERVFPMDKQTNELIRSPEKIKSQNYEQKLRKACERLGAEFVSYDEVHGTWKFKVGHFSKYGLDVDEEDEEEDPAALSKQAQKGLGGIPQQKLHHPRTSLGVVSLGGRPGPAGDAPMPIPGRMSLPAFMHTQAGPSNQLLDASVCAPPASDVELNPLTPCDTDDDEDDDLDDDDGDEDLEENLDIRHVRPSEMLPPSQLQTAAPPTPKYKPILKDCGTEKTQMMKYAMSMEDFEDRDHTSSVGIMDCQPPIKKSKPSLPTKRVSIMPELSFEDGHRLKERLSATKKAPLAPLTRPPPPAIIPEDPMLFNEERKENLFSSLESKTLKIGRAHV